MKPLGLLAPALGFALTVGARDTFALSSWRPSDIIRRDVVVVGGGAAGTYAAINLKDRDKSVILVEKTNRLGGNAVTYYDPVSGGAVDYGVQVYDNTTIVRDFFDRLGTPLANLSFASLGRPVYADFDTGDLLNITIDSLGEDYLRELDKYPYLEHGFELPNPVPEDLLLPWGEYIDKFHLDESAGATLSRPAVAGNVLDILALYVFNNYNRVMLHEASGFAVVNAHRDNSELYRNALEDLGPEDVLLESTVIAGQRSTSKRGGVRLVVQTPQGRKLLVAKQLLLGIPPVTETTRFFGLDPHEHRILSQIYGLPYYAGVVNNTGLAPGYAYKNYAPDTEYNLPKLPAAVQIMPSPVEGLFYYWYNSLRSLSQERVEQDVREGIKAIQRATNTSTRPEPEFLAFTDFGPYQFRVSAESIRRGFYRKMYGLQGYRNTWYIAAMFVTGSSQVWNNTAEMMPEIVSAIDLA